MAHAEIQGHCDDKFQPVRIEFENNFAERGEIGAGVAIYFDGKLLVDLWGGVADQSDNRPWKRDTLAEVFSSTKGMTAACVHLLIDRGLLDLDAPVAQYWPEFSANGKERITVATALSHQAGLPIWRAPVPKGGLFDWDLACSLLAREAPIWEPGTAHGYHAVTSGFLWGELVRRVTGKTIGRFLREEIADPIGADVWIGLPETEESRISDIILGPSDPNSELFAKAQREPDWIGAQMLNNVGEVFAPDIITSRAFRAHEGPSYAGVASAHGLARMYAPFSLDGAIEGVRMVSANSLPAMRRVRSASGCDQLLRIATTFTLGFSNSWGARRQGAGNHMILGEHAFGTPGMGGSMGFADGQARMSFGYVMNMIGPGVALNDRGQSMIDAAYRVLGYSDAVSAWVR